MVYNSSASQQRPCEERECQPRLHQVTAHHRCRTPYGDQSAIHHCHKSSIGPPATLVQQLWSLGRSHHSNAWRRAITPILKLRVPSLTCTDTNKHRACCLQTATTTHGEGTASAAPFITHYICKQLPFTQSGTLRNSEDRRPKAQDHCSFTVFTYHMHLYLCIFIWFLYYCTACVLFRIPCKYFRTMQ